MLSVLRYHGIPETLDNAIQVLYTNSSSSVMVDGSISKPFCVSTGVLQGDILAPFLFIILVDYLLLRSSDGDYGVLRCPRKSRRYSAKVLNDLDFADDIALLKSSKSRAHSQLTRTASAAADLGIVISASKTEYIAINCCPQPPLEVYGSTINHVEDFKYLGAMMACSSGDFKRRKGLALTAFWKLEHLWRCSTISIFTEIKLFNTTCVTVLLYGCELWVLSKAMESEINAFGTSCYRIMLNIKRIDRVSNATIYDLTQASPLVENVRTRQLRFLSHVLRLPDDEPCKEYALYVPPHGKRKPGGQRTLFLTYIQNLLGDTDNMIGPDKLSELAQDRCDWKKIVVACSAADR